MKDLIWETRKVKVKDLIQLEINPRKITEEKRKALTESLNKFNLVEIPAVNTDLKIIGGNQRVMALMLSGREEEEIDVRFPNRKLTDKEVKEYAIISNTHAGEFDFDLLESDFAEIDLSDIGFELDGLDEWLQEKEKKTAKQAKEDDYEVPDGGIETDIVLGDLFEIGPHRLLCGDSTDSDQVAKLMNGEKADMVFTSPPYNTGGFHATESKNSKKYGAYPYLNDNDSKSQSEYLLMNKKVIDNIKIHSTDSANLLYNISYNQNSPYEFVVIIYDAIQSGWKLHETIVWKKSSATPLRSRLTRSFEFIFMLSKDKGKNPPTNQKFEHTEFNHWEISNSNTQSKDHGASFPVELPKKGIELFCLGEIVFEPFTGSGSTMVASHQLDRTCYGMELDPKYCQVIVDRMKKLDPELVVKKNGEVISGN